MCRPTVLLQDELRTTVADKELPQRPPIVDSQHALDKVSLRQGAKGKPTA